MKFTILLLAVFAIVAVCHAQAQDVNDPAYTGQPGCLTEEEVAIGLYPHFRIKRAYWRCSVLGEAATLEVCPIAQGFLEPARACVSWALWYWTPTVAPPSAPASAPVTAAPEGSGQ